jgi:NAD-dependent deacetylase
MFRRNPTLGWIGTSVWPSSLHEVGNPLPRKAWSAVAIEDSSNERMEHLVGHSFFAERILVVTGAGISLASGIPTFRGSDPGAVWENELLEKGTISYFLREPVESWKWYAERFVGLWKKDPNEAHHALEDLARWAGTRRKNLRILTQNIDCLHRKAGSDSIEVHGRSDRVRCIEPSCRMGGTRGSLPAASFDFSAFLVKPTLHSLPKCPQCGGLLRPHVLWFDEYYTSHTDYRYDEAIREIARCDLLLFIGTSFSVGITETALQYGHSKGIPMWSIDPVSSPGTEAVYWLQAAAEEALPSLLERLIQESVPGHS